MYPGTANLAGAGLVGARLGAGPGCPSRGVAHPGGGEPRDGRGEPAGAWLPPGAGPRAKAGQFQELPSCRLTEYLSRGAGRQGAPGYLVAAAPGSCPLLPSRCTGCPPGWPHVARRPKPA